MNDRYSKSTREKWAQLRFAIIGPLLAAPPAQGELQEQLQHLSSQAYRHPTNGKRVSFSLSTLERWFYQAKNNPDDPFSALARKVHSSSGTHPSMSGPVKKNFIFYICNIRHGAINFIMTIF